MTTVGNATSGIGQGFEVLQNAAWWLIEGPRKLFSDVDATGDLLKLAQRIHKIFEPFISILPLKQIAEGVTAITEFVNARCFFGGLYDLITGGAAWEKPFSENFPNLFKVAGKLAFLVGDLSQLAGWLSSLHVLGSWVKDSTARIVTWGKEFNVLQGIGDATCIIGSLLGIADTVRLVLQEAITDGYVKNGSMKMSVLFDHVVDLAYDVSNIAAAVLSNIPGVPDVLSIVSLAVGSTLSLGKFFKNIYWKEPLVEKSKV